MKKSNKGKLNQCLKILYSGIYRCRMLLRMHILISDASQSLINHDFWGCLQNNLVISVITIEIFSIFDNNQIIKRLDNLLKNDEEFADLTEKINLWKDRIKKYDKFRHGLAHKADHLLEEEKVDYQNIIDLLADFEFYLNKIHKTILGYAYEPITNPCEKSLPCLCQLKQILENEKLTQLL